YLVPQGKPLLVTNGEKIKAGDPLTSGPVNPHDVLKVRGESATQEYLLENIQEVYRSQGVEVNDKHIEVIIRQMLRRVRIEDSGDTEFLVGQEVDRLLFKEENEKIMKKKGKPAMARPILLGITKASLSTESVFAAASFQETTRVLTDAATIGKVDNLVGLKENIIIGRLIPAGTGAPAYRTIQLEKAEKVEKADKEAESKEEVPVE
ncbi:MAG: DNA-directed RNA polymerase subunit beta', partial [Candidatus Firestonebacteria bacterium]